MIHKKGFACNRKPFEEKDLAVSCVTSSNNETMNVSRKHIGSVENWDDSLISKRKKNLLKLPNECFTSNVISNVFHPCEGSINFLKRTAKVRFSQM